MKKQVSPVLAAIVVVVVVLVAAAVIWRGTQKQVNLPDKPPSGPIALPPSQQGRIMPGSKAFSGSAQPHP
jgi:flagellin-like protein